jgi:hypothetical protein
MRRTYVWGAAVGAGLLATSAFAAPAALAATAGSTGVSASAAKTPAKHGRVVAKSHHHGRNRHQHNHCPYPPNGTPSVALNGPDHSHPGFTVNYTGKVTLNNCGYDGVLAGLYASTDGTTGWTKVADTTTDKNGGISFSQTAPAIGTLYMRVVVAGDGHLSYAQSNVFTLTVKKPR